MILEVKCALGFGLSLLGLLVVMPFFIDLLKKHSITQNVSEYSLKEYKEKAKTPIMGGLLFVVLPVIVYGFINWNGFINSKVLFCILSYLSFCFVGFLDDFMIIIKHNNDGISPSSKLIMEFVFVFILYWIFKEDIACALYIPFLNTIVYLDFFYVPFMILMFLSEANAVNFTDGMDGLCAGVSFIGLAFFEAILLGEQLYDIAILVFCVLGGLLGYLRFNYHPAKIFMGDSGSLALGGLFSSIAVMSGSEVALLFIGGVFVIEMLCVVIQQLSVRLFHKRVFSYTPIHYAFVLKGYKETTIVPCFYLLTILFSILGLYLGY